MIRETAEKAAWLILLPVAVGSAGCGPNPPTPVVYRIETGDYKFEYDGLQKRATIGRGLMRMVRSPEDIEVSDGTLRVGNRDYGAVSKDDTISVIGKKVTVNGQVRQALAP